MWSGFGRLRPFQGVNTFGKKGSAARERGRQRLLSVSPLDGTFLASFRRRPTVGVPRNRRQPPERRSAIPIMRIEDTSGGPPHFLRSISYDPTFDSYLSTNEYLTKEIHTLHSTIPWSDMRDVSDGYYPFIYASGDGNFADGQPVVNFRRLQSSLRD
jgi:hypothetical protein